MEIALKSDIPTYSGGLGVLAGDTIRSAADLSVPMLAVTLLHRKGYFSQSLREGVQEEAPASWPVESVLRELPQRITMTLEGRSVVVRAWEYRIAGIGGAQVPVYFLDVDLPENDPADRRLTDSLYGGDQRYRLCQEAILGIGGVRILRAMGHTGLRRFHMNEGHASLLALELLDEHVKRAGREEIESADIEAVRRLCVFTTHTPVSAGHDQFPMDLVVRTLGRRDVYTHKEVFCCEGVLNMTYLALNLSHYVNGVAKRHGEISRLMFARYPIDSITNGVHAATWASPQIAALLDRDIPDWRQDNFSLRQALRVPGADLWHAHSEAKQEMLRLVNRETGADLQADCFTIGFARRAATYKRADLVLSDLERLKRLSLRPGLQLVYAGKAHPKDESGRNLIAKILSIRDKLRGHVKIAYVENYDMDWGRLLTAGTDLWLNTPQPPMEASGTSGMKAALNGVPSLSVLDGWWVEGSIEGLTGWAIGTEGGGSPHDPARDADALYDKLERTILPLYYEDRERFIDVMRHAIALNGSFFNTQRMLQQYITRAYL